MSETDKVPHGQKTIKVKVVFWTNNLEERGQIKRGHAWYSGMAHIEANSAHGIKSQPDPVPFNTPDEMQGAIEACLRTSNVVMHDIKNGAVLDL